MEYYVFELERNECDLGETGAVINIGLLLTLRFF